MFHDFDLKRFLERAERYDRLQIEVSLPESTLVEPRSKYESSLSNDKRRLDGYSGLAPIRAKNTNYHQLSY